MYYVNRIIMFCCYAVLYKITRPVVAQRHKRLTVYACMQLMWSLTRGKETLVYISFLRSGVEAQRGAESRHST